MGMALSILTMSILWFALPRFQAQTYRAIFLIGNDKIQYWTMRKLASPELIAEADIISDCCLILIHRERTENNANSEFLDGEIPSFLSRLGPHPHVDIEGFSRELENPDSEVRQAVIKFLGNQRQAASPAIPKLIDAVKRYDQDAVIALNKIGPKAVPDIIRHIQEGGDEDRRLLLRVLYKIGPPAAPAVPTLIPLLNDKNLDVVYSAIVTLGAIGPEAAPAVPALTKHLSNSIPKLRQKAIWSLGNMGAAAKTARPILKQLLADPSEKIRAEARHALEMVHTDLEQQKAQVRKD